MFVTKLTSFILKFSEELICNLPCPKNLNFFWNFGSFLGLILVFQLVSGIFLTFFYSNTIISSFLSLEYMERLVYNGFIFRIFHMNAASLFFFVAYSHMFRGLYFFSFRNSNSWSSGVTILLLLMATAFLGYVLPWGQMSFWAATVITKFFSVIPFIGVMVVQWIWSGFSVGGLTLKFFFSLHFLLPLVLVVLVLIHLFSVHFFGSSSPLFMSFQESKMVFSPYLIFKDLVNLCGIFFLLFTASIWMSSESVNFIQADPSSSPAHIKPEWYFLFAYAILRSVPNKLLGVILMGLALALFYILSAQKELFLMNNYLILGKIWFFSFLMNFMFLSWVGGNPVTDLFVVMGFGSSMLYFSLFLFITTSLAGLKFHSLN